MGAKQATSHYPGLIHWDRYASLGLDELIQWDLGIEDDVLKAPFFIVLYWIHFILTHWGRHKMDAISQTTFWSAFSWMKMYEFRLRFHWSLFLRVQLTIFQHWFRKWLGADQATSHYLKQWWLVYRRIYASLGLNGHSSHMYFHGSYW